MAAEATVMEAMTTADHRNALNEVTRGLVLGTNSQRELILCTARAVAHLLERQITSDEYGPAA